ncbi:MAG: hypothetical protein V4451_14490 [Pseudomonadota bacterium]
MLTSVFTFNAFAQTPPPPAPAPQRGEVEGRPMLEKNFDAIDAIDAAKDGQLTRVEMKAYREAHKGERRK